MRTFLLIFSVFMSLVSCSKKLTESEKMEYIVKGKEVISKTADSMLIAVARNMKEGGVLQAVSYCNAHAIPITEEFSKNYNVQMKRTSHLLRNSNNEPDQREKEIIESFLNLNKENKNISPIVEKNKDGSVQFYAPIFLQEKCSTCHGILGKSMELKNDSIIKKLYPDDKAVGFKEGDIRGIWSLKFKNKTLN